MFCKDFCRLQQCMTQAAIAVALAILPSQKNVRP
jgi:hypothetical protein